ncbi:hypothetical protein A0J61_10852 [Choanephora cucurbitarum]|uniref:Uncharacterized protein n=1 Tax=Choanephora cucurbitarum TaxID=101091 RepID=A0A1C7MXG2_9FUNG|nr:hypothetical protein A0J61_10852 [Choanephora cucurbitarum]
MTTLVKQLFHKLLHLLMSFIFLHNIRPTDSYYVALGSHKRSATSQSGSATRGDKRFYLLI